MIRKYLMDDVFKVNVQKMQQHEAKMGLEFFNFIEAYTLTDDDKILGVFGFDKISKNEVQCFALFGENSGRKFIELVKFLNKEISWKTKTLKIKKIFITVRSDFYQAHRLAKILGFRVVRKIPLFFNDIDYYLYERS